MELWSLRPRCRPDGIYTAAHDVYATNCSNFRSGACTAQDHPASPHSGRERALLQAARSDGVQVGCPFVGDGASIPTSGDKYLALTLKSQCDITSAEVEFEKDEIDITTLCDDIRKYASGFSDATGTLEGITTLDLSEPMIAKFVTVQKQDNLGAITTIAQNDDPLVVVIELNKIDNSDADRALFFAPVTLNGYTLGVNIDDAQTFSSGFRIAQDNDIKPILVEADKALFTTGSST